MTANILFWTCAALIVIAQVMILRSTRRAHRHVGPAHAAEAERATRGGAMEWLFAIGPAVAIAFLLYFTWRAATQPPVMNVRFDETGPVSAVTTP